FQAEDGIRDDLVTGVQTCALPIWDRDRRGRGLDLGARQACRRGRDASACRRDPDAVGGTPESGDGRRPAGEPGLAADACRDEARSEERRVGKEGRDGGEATELETT